MARIEPEAKKKPTYDDIPPPRPGLRRLVIDGRCVVPDEKLLEQCMVARQSGFPQLLKGQVPPYTDPLIIVGSGLTVRDHLNEIRARAEDGIPVMAVKGAYDWLIENGITPTMAIAADPQAKRAQIFKQLNDETVYLCASQMHPDTWDYMKGRKVIIWHGMVNLPQQKMEEWKDIPLVQGGCTTGLRALSVAWILGFRDLQLYGFDSCVSPDGEARIDGGKTFAEKDRITIYPGDGTKGYLTSLNWAKQADELRLCLSILPGVKVTAYGDGLFQEVLRQGKASGWPV